MSTNHEEMAQLLKLEEEEKRALLAKHSTLTFNTQIAKENYARQDFVTSIQSQFTTLKGTKKIYAVEFDDSQGVAEQPKVVIDVNHQTTTQSVEIHLRNIDPTNLNLPTHAEWANFFHADKKSIATQVTTVGALNTALQNKKGADYNVTVIDTGDTFIFKALKISGEVEELTPDEIEALSVVLAKVMREKINNDHAGEAAPCIYTHPADGEDLLKASIKEAKAALKGKAPYRVLQAMQSTLQEAKAKASDLYAASAPIRKAVKEYVVQPVAEAMTHAGAVMADAATYQVNKHHEHGNVKRLGVRAVAYLKNAVEERKDRIEEQSERLHEQKSARLIRKQQREVDYATQHYNTIVDGHEEAWRVLLENQALEREILLNREKKIFEKAMDELNTLQKAEKEAQTTRHATEIEKTIVDDPTQRLNKTHVAYHATETRHSQEVTDLHTAQEDERLKKIGELQKATQALLTPLLKKQEAERTQLANQHKTENNALKQESVALNTEHINQRNSLRTQHQSALAQHIAAIGTPQNLKELQQKETFKRQETYEQGTHHQHHCHLEAVHRMHKDVDCPKRDKAALEKKRDMLEKRIKAIDDHITALEARPANPARARNVAILNEERAALVALKGRFEAELRQTNIVDISTNETKHTLDQTTANSNITNLKLTYEQDVEKINRAREIQEDTLKKQNKARELAQFTHKQELADLQVAQNNEVALLDGQIKALETATPTNDLVSAQNNDLNRLTCILDKLFKQVLHAQAKLFMQAAHLHTDIELLTTQSNSDELKDLTETSYEAGVKNQFNKFQRDDIEAKSQALQQQRADIIKEAIDRKSLDEAIHAQEVLFEEHVENYENEFNQQISLLQMRIQQLMDPSQGITPEKIQQAQIIQLKIEEFKNARNFFLRRSNVLVHKRQLHIEHFNLACAKLAETDIGTINARITRLQKDIQYNEDQLVLEESLYILDHLKAIECLSTEHDTFNAIFSAQKAEQESLQQDASYAVNKLKEQHLTELKNLGSKPATTDIELHALFDAKHTLLVTCHEAEQRVLTLRNAKALLELYTRHRAALSSNDLLNAKFKKAQIAIYDNAIEKLSDAITLHEGYLRELNTDNKNIEVDHEATRAHHQEVIFIKARAAKTIAPLSGSPTIDEIKQYQIQSLAILQLEQQQAVDRLQLQIDAKQLHLRFLTAVMPAVDVKSEINAVNTSIDQLEMNKKTLQSDIDLHEEVKNKLTSLHEDVDKIAPALENEISDFIEAQSRTATTVATEITDSLAVLASRLKQVKEEQKALTSPPQPGVMLALVQPSTTDLMLGCYTKRKILACIQHQAQIDALMGQVNQLNLRMAANQLRADKIKELTATIVLNPSTFIDNANNDLLRVLIEVFLRNFDAEQKFCLQQLSEIRETLQNEDATHAQFIKNIDAEQTTAIQSFQQFDTQLQALRQPGSDYEKNVQKAETDANTQIGQEKNKREPAKKAILTERAKGKNVNVAEITRLEKEFTSIEPAIHAATQLCEQSKLHQEIVALQAALDLMQAHYDSVLNLQKSAQSDHRASYQAYLDDLKHFIDEKKNEMAKAQQKAYVPAPVTAKPNLSDPVECALEMKRLFRYIICEGECPDNFIATLKLILPTMISYNMDMQASYVLLAGRIFKNLDVRRLIEFLTTLDKTYPDFESCAAYGQDDFVNFTSALLVLRNFPSNSNPSDDDLKPWKDDVALVLDQTTRTYGLLDQIRNNHSNIPAVHRLCESYTTQSEDYLAAYKPPPLPVKQVLLVNFITKLNHLSEADKSKLIRAYLILSAYAASVPPGSKVMSSLTDILDSILHRQMYLEKYVIPLDAKQLVFLLKSATVAARNIDTNLGFGQTDPELRFLSDFQTREFVISEPTATFWQRIMSNSTAPTTHQIQDLFNTIEIELKDTILNKKDHSKRVFSLSSRLANAAHGASQKPLDQFTMEQQASVAHRFRELGGVHTDKNRILFDMYVLLANTARSAPNTTMDTLKALILRVHEAMLGGASASAHQAEEMLLMTLKDFTPHLNERMYLMRCLLSQLLVHGCYPENDDFVRKTLLPALIPSKDALIDCFVQFKLGLISQLTYRQAFGPEKNQPKQFDKIHETDTVKFLPQESDDIDAFVALDVCGVTWKDYVRAKAEFTANPSMEAPMPDSWNMFETPYHELLNKMITRARPAVIDLDNPRHLKDPSSIKNN